jgi:hypothetical protein
MNCLAFYLLSPPFLTIVRLKTLNDWLETWQTLPPTTTITMGTILAKSRKLCKQSILPMGQPHVGKKPSYS